VLNSSSADQWLRKDIATSNGVGGGGPSNDQPNGLDINLDTILSNYPYVKTECFSYDDSGFGTAESSKEDLTYQQHTSPTKLFPQSSGVTTTSVLLESNLNAAGDLISYTDMSNNNNEWNIDRNEIKDWETCEANVRIATALVIARFMLIEIPSRPIAGITRVAASFGAPGQGLCKNRTLTEWHNCDSSAELGQR
jgi:hypothetical protein